jgi:hypothetical protein
VMITQPAKRKALFKGLPSTKLEAIAHRDSKS